MEMLVKREQRAKHKYLAGIAVGHPSGNWSSSRRALKAIAGELFSILD
jgi:hypothetical protein